MGIFQDFRDFRQFRGSRVTYYESKLDPLVLTMDACAIYATQPNLQSIISFLADNVASIPLKVYSRESDTDRRRITDDAVAKTLAHPNGNMTTFELVNYLVSDYLLFGRSLLMAVDAETESGWELYPVPSHWVVGYEGGDSYAPAVVNVMAKGTDVAIAIPLSELCIFSSYSPQSPRSHTAPIMALRDTLTEQMEANRFRGQMWRRGGRFNAYITRPKDVEPWSEGAADRFKTALRETWAGGGENSGGIPVFEDGMEVRQVQFSAREAQWLEAKKLSREEIAGIYHVNPSLIWHTDTQTYASAKDNKRALYAETLDPIFARFEQRLNAFLLPKLGASPLEYCEFDLSKKLAASFEEQASIMQSSCGAPWLTRNEARARMNLPAIDGADELIVPLNVLEGGLASPNDTAPDGGAASAPAPAAKAKADKVSHKARADEDDAKAFEEALAKFFERQARSIAPKIANGSADWWDAKRWDKELADDLEPLALAAATKAGRRAMAGLRLSRSEYREELTERYVRKMAEGRAKAINEKTKADAEGAIRDGADVSERLASKSEQRKTSAGRAFAAAVAGWAALEAVRQSAAETAGRKVTKTWIVTSDNPRGSHAALDGETVDYDGTFSNGAKWPGDTGALDAGEVCNCKCEVEITIH